jgi:hypothetical protein
MRCPTCKNPCSYQPGDDLGNPTWCPDCDSFQDADEDDGCCASCGADRGLDAWDDLCADCAGDDDEANA